MRWLGLVVGGLVAVVALAAALFFTFFDGDRIKQALSQRMLEQKQRTLTIEGTPKLSLWPNVGVSLQRVTLSERASATPFASLQSARVSVALWPLLSKQVQVRGLEVDGLELSVVQARDGSMNYADLLTHSSDPAPATTSAADATAPAPPLVLDIAGVHITNAKFAFRKGPAASPVVVDKLTLRTGRVQADTAAKTLSVAAVTLLASLTDPQHSAQAQLTVTDVQGTAESLQIASMALAVEGKSGADTFTARLSSPVAVNLGSQTLVLPTLQGQLELASPRMPMKQLRLPITGSLQVDAARPTAALALNTQFDASKIAAKLSASSFAPLALAFDLEVDQLNVDTYLPPSAEKKEPTSGSKETPVDLAVLHGPSVRGKIRVGALQVAGIKLARINATLALDNGRLAVAPLSMGLYQGTASGSLTLNAKGNSVALQQTLADVSINPLMQDVVHKDLIEGRGTVLLDIKTEGASVAAMKRGLSGSASLRLKDGAIKGINLAQTVRDIKSKLGAQADTTQQAQAGQKTDFSELSASFSIANGVAHNDDLAMKAPYLRLGGVGDFDIGAGQMNYVAKASVVGNAEGQGGKGMDQMKGLTVPVRVSGPFESLSYKIEFGNMVSDAAKASLEEKKQDIQRQVEDKAKDLLKGLLGR